MGSERRLCLASPSVDRELRPNGSRLHQAVSIRQGARSARRVMRRFEAQQEREVLRRVSARFGAAHLIAINSTMHVANLPSTNACGKKIFPDNHRPHLIGFHIFARWSTWTAYGLNIDISSPRAGWLTSDRPIAREIEQVPLRDVHSSASADGIPKIKAKQKRTGRISITLDGARIRL
jgi:hypothetical protein